MVVHPHCDMNECTHFSSFTKSHKKKHWENVFDTGLMPKWLQLKQLFRVLVVGVSLLSVGLETGFETIFVVSVLASVSTLCGLGLESLRSR